VQRVHDTDGIHVRLDHSCRPSRQARLDPVDPSRPGHLHDDEAVSEPALDLRDLTGQRELFPQRLRDDHVTGIRQDGEGPLRDSFLAQWPVPRERPLRMVEEQARDRE
jgi:hypothetical protein